LAKKWTDRIGDLGRRIQDLIRDLTGNARPEPVLVPVRVRVPRS
jgi:hypothetical protein